MYNQFIATKLRRSKTVDSSSSTAGAAKTSTVTARSKSELRELGERMQWTPGLRTTSEIKMMSSQQILWEEVWNTENYNKALLLPAIGKHNDAAMKQWANKRMWEGKTTEKEDQRAFEAASRFGSNYSQFIVSDTNTWAITNYMADNNLDPTEVSSYVKAFEQLVPLGKLALNPSAIGAGCPISITTPFRMANVFALMGAMRGWAAGVGGGASGCGGCGGAA
jgi:hypothetical protein